MSRDLTKGNVFRTLSILIGGIAVVLTACSIILGDWFLQLLNTPEEAFSHAHIYVLICSAGIIFTGFYNMISAVFRGLGDSRHPLVFIAVASIINIILDLVFVCIFQMGAGGAALATVIGQAVSVICSACYLQYHRDEYGFSMFGKKARFDKGTAVTISRLGIPMALQTSAVYVSFLFVSSMINELGVVVSATFGAMQKIRNLPNMATQAVGLGATAMVGQNFGAGKTERVRQVYISGCRIFLTWFMGRVLGLGMAGYFMGYTLATYVTAIPQVIYYISGKWKKRKNLVEQT